MSKKLKIADDLSFPIDAVTQTFGILSVRGAGKTNTAAVMAEEMFKADLPFVVIDPVGSWWGLRSKKNGKDPGLPIPIFGGRHGDVPLEKSGGQLISDLITDERLSCVLDCSDFSEGDKIRFLIDFAERLYRKNQDPLHLFLEEADDFIPQRPFREQARLLRAWENVVRRGRARGLGITMITQRSAAINKNVLTQIETLIALRTTSPNDRKAIEAWVDYHGQSREVIDSLPGLEDGEAWVWSPSWLKLLKRVKVRRRETFDSGATPRDLKGKRPPATLADVNLGEIQKRMAATIEKAKTEDPRELKRQVADLERELKARKPNKIESDPTLYLKEIKEQAQKISALAKENESWSKRFNLLSETVHSAFLKAGMGRDSIVKMQPLSETNIYLKGSNGQRRLAQSARSSTAIESRQYRNVSRAGEKLKIVALNGDESLGKCETTILATLFRHGECNMGRLALLSGYRKSGGFKNSISKLRGLGYLDGSNTGVMRVTEAGSIVEGFNALPTGRDLFVYWLNSPRMGTCEREIMRMLDGRRDGSTMEEIAENAGYALSGGFKNSLSKLRTAGVIVGRNTERMRLSEELM